MKRLTLLWSILVLLVTATANASVIDAPHNETNNIKCASCHTYSLWWKYSPATTNVEKGHTEIVNIVCMTCHDTGSLLAVKTHSSSVMGSNNNYHGGWGIGCTDCHDPHYQRQLEWGTDAYLIEGKIDRTKPNNGITPGTFTAVDGKVYDQTTIAIVPTLTKDDANWPLANWVKKNGNPGRGLILAQDTALNSNTFSILSATPTEIVVKGLLAATAVVPSLDPDGSGPLPTNSATADTFGLAYGQLIKKSVTIPYSTPAQSGVVKFVNPIGGFVDTVNPTPTGICQVCHTLTTGNDPASSPRFRNSGAPTAGADSHANYNNDTTFGGTSTCTSCHVHLSGFKGGGHGATDFGWAPISYTKADGSVESVDCATCHDNTKPIIEGVHGNKCVLCHVDAGGGGPRRVAGSTGADAVNSFNGIDGDPSGADKTATCATCHDKAIMPNIENYLPQIHHTATINNYAANGDCTHCHKSSAMAATPLTKAADHSSKIILATTSGTPPTKVNGCEVCHQLDPATNTDYSTHGTITGAIIDAPGVDNPRVHDSCTACHKTDGTLKNTVFVTNPGHMVPGYMPGHGAGSKPDLDQPTTCFSCHGPDPGIVHLNHNHTNTVGNTPQCNWCHYKQVGLSNGATTDPNDPMVHWACTTCHTISKGVAGDYSIGIVKVADLTRGIVSQIVTPQGKGSPVVCTDCHAIHLFKDHQHPDHTNVVKLSSEGCTDSCHNATAGKPGPGYGMPISATDPKVHRDCSACHDIAGTGELRSVAAVGLPYVVAMPNGALVNGVNVPNDGGGECSACHGAAYFTRHTHTHKVAIQPTDLGQADSQPCSNCHTVTAWSDILTLHLSTCSTCHSASRLTGNTNAPTETVADVIAAKVNPTACLSCHRNKTAPAAHGAHDATTFGWSGNCVDCHGPNSLAVVMDIHQSQCTLCHVSPGTGNYTRKAGSKGSAIGATVTSTCTDCHSASLYPTGAIHHSTAHASSGDCVYCHTGATHGGNHTALVATDNNCSSCHTATAGTATGVPVDGIAGNKVHDACTTCHTNLGTLKAAYGKAMSMSAGGPASNDGGGNCTACHGDYFANHVTVNHTDRVAISANCSSTACHLTTAGTASGVSVDGTPGTKVHDACSSCHNTNGLLKAGYGKAPLMASPGGACEACHGAYFASHVNVDHTNQVKTTANCNTCHAATAGTNAGVPVDGTPGTMVHDACSTCHNGNGTLKAGYTTSQGKVITMPAGGGDCNACHGVYFTRHSNANHTARVATSTSCNSCHTATAGTATTVPVDGTPGTKVHDACSTCHNTTTGALLAGFGTAPLMASPGGACMACHGGYFPTHTHSHSFTAVAICLNCHVAAAAPFATTGQAHANLGCKTCHDASTGVLINDAVGKTAGADCNTCHSAYFNGHSHTHTMTTVALCVSCHTTATTAPYVATGQTHARLGCQTCHSSTTGTRIGDAASQMSGANCQTCHVAYFAAHTHDHTNLVKVNTATTPEAVNCTATCHNTATTPPFVATGQTHARLGCNTCHSALNGSLIGSAAGHLTGGECVTCHTAYVTGHSAVAHKVAITSSDLGQGAPGTPCSSCHTVTLWNDIYTLHFGLCSTCHSTSRLTGNPTKPTETVADIITAQAQVGCLACHWNKQTPATHGGHSATDFAWDATTQTTCGVSGCHNANVNTNVILTVHQNLCSLCHVNPAGGGTRKAGVDGDATLAGTSNAASCTVCHNGTTYPKGFIHHDTANAVSGNCTLTCHNVSGHEGNHTALVATDSNCTVICHTATAGAITGVPVDGTAGTMVHDACTTCHTNLGPLKVAYGKAMSMSAGGPLSNDGGGNCTSCHGAYFPNHTNANHTARVATSGNCASTLCHAATAGTATTVPVDGTPGNKVHDACATCHDGANSNRLKAAYGKAPLMASPGGACEACHGAYFPGHVNVDHTNLVKTTANCNTCHTATAGTTAGVPVDGTPGNLVHDACSTCHNADGTLKSSYTTTAGKPITMPVAGSGGGDCNTCHGAYFSSHSNANHTALVATDTKCASCHTATAGTVNGVPVDGTPGTKVHDACTTCHSSTGTLLAAYGKAPLMSAGGAASNDGGGNCSACHGAYFSTHTHSHSMGTVSICLNCHTASAAPFVTTGQAHANLGCLTCHSAANGVLIGDAVGKTSGATCSTCHSTYPNGHSHAHSMATVALCSSCHTATTAPYVATGQTHAPLNCSTCHSSTTFLRINDAAGKTAGASCSTCHNTYFNGHSHNHSTVVKANSLTSPPTANCIGCHAATTTPFVATGQVHATNSCQTCHDTTTNGSLKGSATGHTTGGECITCHTTYFNGHSHTPHLVALQVTDLGQAAPGTACWGTATSPCHNDGGANLSTWTSIFVEHKSDCTKCHNETRLTGNPSAPAETVQDVIAANANPTACLACHWNKKSPAAHGGHDSTQFTTTDTACTVCHTVPTSGVVAGIHSNNCLLCHTSAGGGTGTTKIGDNANANALLGASAAPHTGISCLTCHAPATYSITYIHHRSKYAANNDCVHCHTSSTADINALPNHSATVPATAPCTTCHTGYGSATGITVSLTDGAIHDSCRTCHTFDANYRGILVNFTNNKGVNGTGTLPNGGTIGGTNGGGACYVCHTVATTTPTSATMATIHHASPRVNVGQCEYCHADPRPSWSSTNAPGDNGTLSGLAQARPTQMACVKCHVAFTGTNMTVTKYVRTDYTTYKTDWTRTTQHTIPMTGTRINNYGICLSCHYQGSTVVPAVSQISMWHGNPARFGGTAWTFYNQTASQVSGKDWKRSSCDTSTTGDKSHFLPGRSRNSQSTTTAPQSLIGGFNIFAPNYGIPPTDSVTNKTQSNRCDTTGGKDKVSFNTLGYGTPAFTRVTLPTNVTAFVANTPVTLLNTTTRAVPVFASLAPVTGAPPASDNVQVVSTTPSGSTVVVVASTSNATGCSTLTAVYGASSVQMTGASPSCTATVTGYPANGTTLNVNTSNATGFNVTGYRISAPAAADTTPPTDGALTVTPGNTQNSLAWTAATDAGGLRVTNTYDVRFLTGATAPTCTPLTGASVYLGTALTSTHTGLANGTQYSYRVCAYDAANNVSTGATGSGTPTAATDTTPPVMGTITATPSTATYVPAAFALTASITETGSAVTSCEYSTNGATWSAGVVSGASSPYTCTANPTGLTGALTLNMRATSTGGIGTGAPLSLTVDATAPATGTLTVTPGSAQNGLSWTASTDAASGLRTANTYDLRFLTGATAPTCTSGVSAYTGTALTYTHTGLTNGTQYSYRVCAYDNVNNVSTGATASGTPSGGGTSVRYDLTYDAAAPSMGLDGAITAIAQTSYNYTATANTNRAPLKSGVTLGATQGRYRYNSGFTGTNYEMARAYTPTYTTANANIAANVPVSIDYYIRTAGGTTGAITAQLYEYNDASGVVGTVKGSWTSAAFSTTAVTSTAATLTGSMSNAAFTVATGNRLEVRFLTTQTGGEAVLLYGATTSGANGKTFITPTESGTGADTTPPTDGVLTVTPGNTQNGLSWTAATDAGGLRATNTYDVRFLSGSTAPTCATGTSAYTGTALSYAHTGLTNGSQYSYRVCAYDAANNVSTGVTGSGTPTASGTVANYYITTQPSTWGVGADGDINWNSLADMFSGSANTNRAGSQTTATTGTAGYLAVPSSVGSGTNQEFFRMYTPAYASAKTLSANIPYTIDTIMDTTGTSASFTLALYDYNPAGANGNGVQIGSTKTITMTASNSNVQHWTGNFGNATSYAIAAGHRLEMRILGTYVSSAPAVLIGNAPNTTGSTSAHGAVFISPTEQ